jgi:very-short-patch-repair endonuclease
MPPKNIVIGQKLDPKQAARARELRRKMTNAERMLWQHLRANHLGGWHFRRQQVIGGYIADFYCHAAGLVVELDGGVHDTQAGYDAERDQVLMEWGLCVLRFKNQEVVEDLERVLQAILLGCERK